jgi:hypothetical protein
MRVAAHLESDTLVRRRFRSLVVAFLLATGILVSLVSPAGATHQSRCTFYVLLPLGEGEEGPREVLYQVSGTFRTRDTFVVTGISDPDITVVCEPFRH